MIVANGTGCPVVESSTRPATTTSSGDTGLWFVPTAEILPAKNWSISAYRVNFDYEQGFTDVSRFPITFGVGIADRRRESGLRNLRQRAEELGGSLDLAVGDPSGTILTWQIPTHGTAG